MSLLPRKSAGKALAKSLHLPSRHLEPLPHGGYVLAREQRRITAADILRAAGTLDDESEEPVSGSALIVGVVGPALAKAENALSNALSRISVEDLARSAAASRKATK